MQVKNFTDNARITSDGQVKIPKYICEILGVSGGDRITFAVDENKVRIVNSAEYAMQQFQKSMEGEAERVGWKSDDDVVTFIKEMRSEMK